MSAPLLAPTCAAEAIAFLAALHPSGYHDVRAFRGDEKHVKSFRSDDLVGLEAFVAEHRAQWNVYHGVATRANATDRDGAACEALYALFVDIDFKDISEAEARSRLAAFPFPPSVILASGGGLHCYWFLTAPILLQEKDPSYVKALLLGRLATLLGGDLKSAEPVHILRVPGTLNHKYTPARDVVIEQMTGARYKERDLCDALHQAAPPLPRASSDPPPRAPLPERLPKGDRNDTLFKEGCRLRQRGYALAEILATLQGLNQERCHPPLDKREVETIAKQAAKYEPSADTFPLTETGDAECFAAHYAGRACYDALRARWLLIEDSSGLWLPDPVEKLRGYAVSTMRARQHQANALADTKKREVAWNWAIRGESTGRLTNLLREARTQPEISNDSSVDKWDNHPHLLGVPGGVVDLRTGIQRKARPDERITMRTGVAYDPSARSELWERTLREISDNDDAWVKCLQRACGYTTTGDTSQDKWFLKHGKNGREGKGTVDCAMMAALGDYVLELPSSVFDIHPKGNPDYDLSYLPGKRFVLSSETGNTVHLNHDRIKNLTGGGKYRAANKYEKSFEFFPVCKLWLACNDLPTVTDDSAAFWARVIVFPFRVSFNGKEDFTLRPTLSNDPAHQRAVLAWLVQGAVDFYRDRGLGALPVSVREATADFRDTVWPLTQLVREDCIVEKDARVSVGDFNLAYQRFCERQGVPADRRLGWKRIIKLMEARYESGEVDYINEDKKRVKGKFYFGIGLREPVEPVPF